MEHHDQDSRSGLYSTQVFLGGSPPHDVLQTQWMGVAVHNSELAAAAGSIAGKMCGAKNLGFGSVAGLVEGSAAVEVEHTVAAQEVSVVVGEVGSVRHVVEWPAVGVGDSMKHARSGLGEGRMEEEHIAAEL